MIFIEVSFQRTSAFVYLVDLKGLLSNLYSFPLDGWIHILKPSTVNIQNLTNTKQNQLFLFFI